MARTKHKVSKLIAATNTHSKNKRLAQLGEFAERPEWFQVFMWRVRVMHLEWEKTHPNLVKTAEIEQRPLNELAKEMERELCLIDEEIGKVVREAMLRGDSSFLRYLAEVNNFLHENFVWKGNRYGDFADMMEMKDAQFIDPLRATIAQEYYFTKGTADEAKKKRSTFMAHIAEKTGHEVDSLGHNAFSRSFDRACKSLGIDWKHNKGKRGAK